MLETKTAREHGAQGVGQADVLIKTQLGLTALRQRDAALNTRMVALLRLADGRRSVAQITELDGARADAAQLLAQLCEAGLLQVMAQARPAVALEPAALAELAPARQAAAPPTPAFFPATAADLMAAKRVLVDWCVKALGPVGSVPLALQIEKSRSGNEVLALLDRMCSLFGGFMSQEAIATHRSAALRTLSGASGE